MNKKSSIQIRQEGLEKMGRNSWEYQETVKKCRNSIAKAERKEEARRLEEEEESRNSTLNMFK